LLPGFFSKVHKKYRTPHVSTWIAGFAVAIPAGIWDIDTFADLSNIGTLFAFIVVSAGVLILRKTQPDRKRSFRVPGCPYFPILSIAFCLVLMMGLPLETWIRFLFWLSLGLQVYLFFGRQHSLLQVAPNAYVGTIWSFQGRAGRLAFWEVQGCLICLTLAAAFLARRAVANGGETVVTLAWVLGIESLIFLAPLSLANQVRRWHDLEKSGWMILLNLVPGLLLIAGWLLLLNFVPVTSHFVAYCMLLASSVTSLSIMIVLGCIPGKKETNRYGTEPLRLS
jgi:uncharacterized membrane protein YhaH (DUF805 family)